MPLCPWSLPTHAVEECLRTRSLSASQATTLAKYFGGARELRALQELQRAGERVQPHTRVLVLPGIMGSKLGTPRPWPLPARLGWIGPRLALGALRELSLDRAPREHGPMGVFEFVYLRLVLHLRALGFAAQAWPYDWRDSVGESAGRLARELLASDERVSIVAHSMGGLVALEAMREAGVAHRVRRCVLVGTPLRGAHGAALALRGTHGLVDWLHTLDVTTSSKALAREVWSSFPSVYELLPRDVSHELLAQAGIPSRAPLHEHRATSQARASESVRACAAKLHCIAGDALATPAGVVLGPKGLRLVRERAGDGTVLRESATSDEASSEVVVGVSHTQLVRSPLALEAIVRGLAGEAPARGQSVRPVTQSVIARPPTPVSEQPTTLLLRGTRTPTHLVVRASVLRAGEALVPVGVSNLPLRVFARAFGAGPRPRDGRELGEVLAQHALPARVRAALAASEGPVVLVCDREASSLPWEAMWLDGRALCASRDVTRALEVGDEDDEAATRGGLVRAAAPELATALVIADPTADLPNAGEEGELVAQALRERGGAVVVLRAGEATRRRVLAEVARGPALVHLAGHAFFDAQRPSRGGVRLADGTLTSEGLLGALVSPGVVVLNACESARTRSDDAGSMRARSAAFQGKGRVGFAEALMRGGVGCVVGTWWPVLDSSALMFASELYRGLATPGTAKLGWTNAVHAARRALMSDTRAGVAMDGANYVLYGVADGAAIGQRVRQEMPIDCKGGAGCASMREGGRRSDVVEHVEKPFGEALC
jgi:hypothetical protein